MANGEQRENRPEQTTIEVIRSNAERAATWIEPFGKLARHIGAIIGLVALVGGAIVGVVAYLSPYPSLILAISSLVFVTPAPIVYYRFPGLLRHAHIYVAIQFFSFVAPAYAGCAAIAIALSATAPPARWFQSVLTVLIAIAAFPVSALAFSIWSQMASDYRHVMSLIRDIELGDATYSGLKGLNNLLDMLTGTATKIGRGMPAAVEELEQAVQNIKAEHDKKAENVKKHTLAAHDELKKSYLFQNAEQNRIASERAGGS